MGMSGPGGKPFDISKRLVWMAWKQVKANKGAAGVDGVSIEEFEADLKDNLYKIWNRMSSGRISRHRCGLWRYRKPMVGHGCLACPLWGIGWRRR